MYLHTALSKGLALFWGGPILVQGRKVEKKLCSY